MACGFPNFVNGVGLVPCGRCPWCLDARVDGWVFRLMYQHRESVRGDFLTLTYAEGMCDQTPNHFLNLNYAHVQLFFKRLRNYCVRKLRWPHKISFYVAGEYGADFQRPHYHIIIFNLPDDVFVLDKATGLRLIETFWVDADGCCRGHIDVGHEFSSAAVGYTIGYCCKERQVGRHPRDDRTKEFSVMSKGLGKGYLTPDRVINHRKRFLDTSLLLDNGKFLTMPRYYRDRIYTDAQKAVRQLELFKRQLEPNEDESAYMKRMRASWSDASLQVWKNRVSYTKNYFRIKKQNRNKL